MKKATGEVKDDDIHMSGGNIQKLVTADGTYASQSAFSQQVTVNKDQERFVLYKVLRVSYFIITYEFLLQFID